MILFLVILFMKLKKIGTKNVNNRKKSKKFSKQIQKNKKKKKLKAENIMRIIKGKK